MTAAPNFKQLISLHADKFNRIVDFDPTVELVLPLDFTANNTELTPEILADTDQFAHWINEKLTIAGAKFGIGGYNEHRTIYGRSTHFDTLNEPRRVHLGVDIWGQAGTPVFNFYDATVHSFKFNNNFGDYGATIILTYNIDGFTFHGLYGHLNLSSLNGLSKNQFIPAGKQFATFGVKEENGYWPPHLHFQLIIDMEGMEGDYPGVCQLQKRNEYLLNCPDPVDIVKMQIP